MSCEKCGGTYWGYIIEGHDYTFMQCSKCGYYLGDDGERYKVKETVERLLSTPILIENPKPKRFI